MPFYAFFLSTAAASLQQRPDFTAWKLLELLLVRGSGDRTGALLEAPGCWDSTSGDGNQCCFVARLLEKEEKCCLNLKVKESNLDRAWRGLGCLLSLALARIPFPNPSAEEQNNKPASSKR